MNQILGTLVQTTTDEVPTTAGATAAGAIFTVLWIITSISIYFVPSIIAAVRKHHNLVPIILVNLFGGVFCGLGWIAALVWSLASPTPGPTQIITVNQVVPIQPWQAQPQHNQHNRTPPAFGQSQGLPPGWHPDPMGSPAERWWDGNQWTDHFQQRPGQLPPLPPGPRLG